MQKGTLGKIFSLASVAAIALPLISAGQVADILPGGVNDPAYRRFDEPTPQECVEENLGHNDYDQPSDLYIYCQNHSVTPVGPNGSIADTDVNLMEGGAGLAIAAALGKISSVIADGTENKRFYKKRSPKSNASSNYDAGDLFSMGFPGSRTGSDGTALIAVATVGAFAVGGSCYLVGKGVYDNFFADKKPGTGDAALAANTAEAQPVPAALKREAKSAMATRQGVVEQLTAKTSVFKGELAEAAGKACAALGKLAAMHAVVPGRESLDRNIARLFTLADGILPVVDKTAQSLQQVDNPEAAASLAKSFNTMAVAAEHQIDEIRNADALDVTVQAEVLNSELDHLTPDPILASMQSARKAQAMPVLA